MSLEAWQQVIDVNLTGVFLCAREAATHMVQQGTGGVIVSISSISRKTGGISARDELHRRTPRRG